MSQLEPDEVKHRVDIVNLIASRGIELKPAGDGFLGLCPLHKDKNHPSLSVSREKAVFNCFACGEKGDIFAFVQKLDGVDFSTALRIVADFAGVGPVATKAHRNGGANGTVKPPPSVAPAAESPRTS